MYLKALEIQGFKSFPEKVRLSFEKDITAIVGPNGSGKSNISDAIRWVMGEQSSKSLRGGKMEDVIFGGTEARNQVGFAQVSLVIDNSARIFNMDNSEVMITRRYYRSGESEYYINRRSVRLKDVNELLMDTGLGREGYSIIGQGRIDEILSAKSTDRREIFEEAAGISRFRHRKDESERKLELTEENLVRINDKISELDMQIEPLKKQAEVAKKYLILRDELRVLEISVWLQDLEKLNAKSRKLTADYDASKEQLEKEQAGLSALYEGTEALSAQMREKDIEGQGIREKITEAQARLSETESASAVLKANLENNTERIHSLYAEMSQYAERAGGIGEQIERHRNAQAGAEAKKEELLEKTGALARKTEGIEGSVGEAAKKLEAILLQAAGEGEAAGAARERLSAALSTAQELLDRESDLSSEYGAALDRLSQARATAEAVQKELEEKSAELEAFKNAVQGRRMLVNNRREAVKEMEDKKSRLTMELNNVRSRASLLTEMEKEYQGYSKAVKTVMQEFQMKNIHGTVADLIKTEDKYTLAIETALGASLQSIIVDMEEDAKAAINFLKRRDGGRATFLPLSSIQSRELNERELDEQEGFEGVAVELVRFDGRYADIYENLLGRTVIAHNMDSAISIGRKYRNRFKIVTMDGQVINAGGAVTGGSTAKNAGILSRANELKRIAVREKALSAELEAAQRELSRAAGELSGMERQFESARSELRGLEDIVLKLKTDTGHHELLTADLSENIESLQGEAQGIANRIELNKKEIEGLKSVISVREERGNELRQEAQTLSAGREELLQESERVSAEIAGLRAEVASLEAQVGVTEKMIAELTDLRTDMESGSGQRLTTIEETEGQNTAIKERIAENEGRLLAIAGEIERHKEALEAVTEGKFELEARRTKCEKEAQEKNRAILDLERECARLQQNKLAADLEEKQIIDKLWDSYELGPTDAQAVRSDTLSYSEAKQRTTAIKREMSSLGTPNLGAIEEFDRVNSRYTFLTEQRDDIEKSKSELLKIISDITSEMKAIFTREFDIINRSFKQTFLDLFGGGRAELELEDEDDILNCGIEIRVQPPGKALKTLTLLSGGEKAFVAIALYFAILKVRPTPFCVMDEIEAALDEGNVIRFANYLRRMSGKTQFIVITHRRGTMEEADHLYGVTMQEKGVSTVLDIDLEEAEKRILAS